MIATIFSKKVTDLKKKGLNLLGGGCAEISPRTNAYIVDSVISVWPLDTKTRNKIEVNERRRSTQLESQLATRQIQQLKREIVA
jgi:hypothetical protein